MLNENFVILAVVINAIGGIAYFFDTINGKVTPNRVTWLLWSIAPMIAFAAEIKEGVGIQSMLTFMIGFNPLIIFITSFFNKKTHWKLGAFDISCGLISVMGLCLWAITKDPTIAIIFSIVADTFAGIPTVVKSYKAPHTENYLTYFTSVLSATIVLLTITTWDFAHYGFPIYILLMNSLLVILIKFRIRKYLARQLS